MSVAWLQSLVSEGQYSTASLKNSIWNVFHIHDIASVVENREIHMAGERNERQVFVSQKKLVYNRNLESDLVNWKKLRNYHKWNRKSLCLTCNGASLTKAEDLGKDIVEN